MIPEGINDEFLEWFREKTEAAWATYEPTLFEDYVASGIGGVDWQRGTKWTGGLSEDEIDRIERQWLLRFPPDYRLFLRKLHSVDRPRKGARYTEYIEGGEESHLIPCERPSFHDWLALPGQIQAMLDRPRDDVLFDIEYNDLWLPSWGPNPKTISERKTRVSALADAAPRLIPVFEHRFLPSTPHKAGNPIVSLHQSDLVLYAGNLRTYLLFEFSYLLNLNTKHDPPPDGLLEGDQLIKNLVFWGDLYTRNL